MSYPDIDSTDYPDGTNECDRPTVDESLANWNAYYDALTDCCVECGGYHGEHAGDCLGVN